MYVNPKYADRYQSQQAVATPPEETGRRLATIERPGRPDERSELRVTLAEFKGNLYLGVRVWQESRDGSGFWPVKGKGVSIRLSEAMAVADALLTGLQFVDEPEPSPRPSSAGAPSKPKLYRPEQDESD